MVRHGDIKKLITGAIFFGFGAAGAIMSLGAAELGKDGAFVKASSTEPKVKYPFEETLTLVCGVSKYVKLKPMGMDSPQSSHAEAVAASVPVPVAKKPHDQRRTIENRCTTTASAA